MKINSKTLRFNKSGSSDVVEHRIRFASTCEAFDYGLQYSAIRNEMIALRLSDLIPKQPGSYSIFITAVDAAGNESDQLDCGSYRYDDMAKLNTKTLRFLPSTSADTVEHRIRINVEGAPFDYATAYSSVPYTAANPVGSGAATPATQVSVNIGSLSNVPSATGTYEVFVTAADASGNESDPLVIHGAVFDFTAPDAPTAGEIV